MVLVGLSMAMPVLAFLRRGTEKARTAVGRIYLH